MTNKRIIAIVAVIIILFLGIFTFANTGEENADNGKNNNDNQNIIDENQDEEKEKEGTNIEEEEERKTTRPRRVSADTTAPIIKLNGNAEVYIDLGTDYTELGANVTDNRDNDKDATISGNVNSLVSGIYALDYTATDAAGNTATPVTRTVKVRPIISVLGNKFNHTMGEEFIPVKAGFSSDLNESSTLINPSSNNVNSDKPGTYYLKYTGSVNGVDATSKTITIVVVDEEDPKINSIDPVDGWNKDNVTVTVNASDNDKVVEYSFDGGATWQEENTTNVTSTSTLQVVVKDASGRLSAIATKEVKIDKIAPIVELIGNEPITLTSGIYTYAQMIEHINIIEENSGIASITYNSKNGNYEFSDLGLQSIKYIVTDFAGKTGELNVQFNITDGVKPTCSIKKVESITAVDGWTKGDVTLTVTANDNVALTNPLFKFSLDNTWAVGNWSISNKLPDFPNKYEMIYSISDGIIKNEMIDVFVKDDAGNISENECEAEIKIDKTNPTIPSNSKSDPIIVSQGGNYTHQQMIDFAKISDTGSGLNNVSYCFDKPCKHCKPCEPSSSGYNFDRSYAKGNYFEMQFVASDKVDNKTTENLWFYIPTEVDFDAKDRNYNYNYIQLNVRVEVSKQYGENNRYRNVTITSLNSKKISVNYDNHYSKNNYENFSNFNDFVATSFSLTPITFTLDDQDNNDRKKATIYFEDELKNKFLIKVELKN